MAQNDRIAALPIWTGAIEIEPLAGGLSNESFKVTDRCAAFVVRFGAEIPAHHVSRAREVMATRAAYRIGVAPELVHAAPGVMVSRFIEGRTYGPEDVQGAIGPVAELVGRFHAQMPAQVAGPGYIFWVFHVIRDYARTLVDGQSRMAGEIPGYLTLAAEFEAAQSPLPIVFGHHDLLPANFIDDGSRLWLIDFEYAGFGTAMFDLAGIASNAGFDADQAEDLLARVFGAALSDDLRRSHAAMQCASLLREAMWSMVSEQHLRAPGVDYEAYTAANLAAFETAVAAYRSRWGTAV